MLTKLSYARTLAPRSSLCWQHLDKDGFAFARVVAGHVQSTSILNFMHELDNARANR